MTPTPTLTGLLGKGQSHLTRYMAETFPYTTPTRQAIRDACGSIRFAPGVPRDGGSVGAAFDILASVVIQPDLVPIEHDQSMFWTTNHVELTRAMTDTLSAAVATSDRSRDGLRAAWVLGLLANSIRTMQAYITSPITGVLRESSGLDETLSLLDAEVIPEAGLEELRRLDGIAVTALYPKLRAPAHLHPWVGNDFVQAEADIIADGLLVDLKTNRGSQTRDGYRWLPAVRDIYQVLAYALLNRQGPAERYGEVNEVGIYAARYGTLVTYPLQGLMDQLAGRAVDADEVAHGIVVRADQESYDPTS